MSKFYFCDKCNKKYKRGDKLKEHYQKDHEQILELLPELKTFDSNNLNSDEQSPNSIQMKNKKDNIPKKSKQEDWNCPKCRRLIFGSLNKDTCGGIDLIYHSDKPGRPKASPCWGKKPIPGDWWCNACKYPVFASKNECPRCENPKPKAKVQQ
jgi:rubrerythrin